MDKVRSPSFYILALVFALFVLFLYGPMITILVLSFQGPQGGLTFPLNGLSFHWFQSLWEGIGTVDIGAALRRSVWLGLIVMVLTVVISVMAGMAFRRRFREQQVIRVTPELLERRALARLRAGAAHLVPVVPQFII